MISVHAQSPVQFQFITNDPDGIGFNDNTPASSLSAEARGNNPGSTIGELRLNVLEAAGGRWAQFLNSNVPVLVDVDFEDLGGSSGGGIALASAGATSYVRNFANAPRTGIYYPLALANSIADTDLRINLSDINVTVNSNSELDSSSGLSWYYGLDGNTPSNLINFSDVIAHELGHGLGFASFANVQTGAFAFGAPDIFSTLIYDSQVNISWENMNNSARATSATNDPFLVWFGPYSNTAADGVSNYITSGKQNFSVAGTSFAAQQADFSSSISDSGFTGNLVLVNDGIDITSDAAQIIINTADLNGNIALVDRGLINFDLKVSRAQDAGALAVIIANNVDGDALISPSGDSTNPVPVIFVSENSGNELKALLSSGNPVNVTMLTSSLIVNEDEDEPATEFQTNIRLHAPSTLQPGSSVSHWSTAASPNLLMEPSINSGLRDNLDLSPLLMKDIGWSTRDITIPHLTYEFWLNGFGINITDLNAAATDDLDDDGIPNILEYLQNLDPLQVSTSSISLENNTLSLRRYIIPNDLDHGYEISSDLTDWDATTVTETTTAIDSQTLEVSSPINTDSEKIFYRYRVKISE
ncbi:MAG: PA domain-containing protein [Akkermansiaceae bacterium]